jgi:hypothetical protein
LGHHSIPAEPRPAAEANRDIVVLISLLDIEKPYLG